MFLRTIKEVTAEDARRIRELRTNYELLVGLNEGKFLSENSGYDNNLWSDSKLKCLEKSIVLDLGALILPKYSIEEDPFIFGKIGTFSYRLNWAGGTVEKLTFVCGPTNYIPGINLVVKNKQEETLFNLGPFYAHRDDRFRHNFDFSIICKIASFFHNKRGLYKNIHEGLVRNREEFYKIINKPFIDYLAALFSVETEEEAIMEFNLPLKNLEKKRFMTRVVKGEMKEIGSLLYFPEKAYRLNQIAINEIKSQVWLNYKNQLIIYSVLEAGIHPENLKKSTDIKVYEESNAFVNDRINDYLEQLAAMTNFGFKILDKIKTTILLEKI
jgi:hypothetical protein